MSGKNNVNPDHYKIAGRDRPNENLQPEVEKKKYAGRGARRKRSKT